MGPVVLTISGHFSDPITDTPKVVTAWIGVPFLVFAVVSIAAANVPNLYSAGLNLLVLGVPVHRGVSIAIAFCISLTGALYALFVSNFIGTFETFLSLSVVWVVPWVAILLVSLLFRRNADEADSASGVRWQACAAGLAGMVVAFLCSNDAVVDRTRCAGARRRRHFHLRQHPRRSTRIRRAAGLASADCSR